MRRYVYSVKFEENVTLLRLGSRSAKIVELVSCPRGSHFIRSSFVVYWTNRDEHEFVRSFSSDNYFVDSAFNGFVNYPVDERGRLCLSFLNMLKRLEYQDNYVQNFCND